MLWPYTTHLLGGNPKSDARCNASSALAINPEVDGSSWLPLRVLLLLLWLLLLPRPLPRLLLLLLTLLLLLLVSPLVGLELFAAAAPAVGDDAPMFRLLRAAAAATATSSSRLPLLLCEEEEEELGL